VTVRLTDKYPNLAALERAASRVDGVHFAPGPVDAMNVPADLAGFRTLFTGLHHFRPRDAAAILAAAVRDRRGIAAFEFTARSAVAVGLMLLVPLVVWLLTPFIRPFRWSRLFWTYLVPVVPFAVLFDGAVSCLRTYTPAELRGMIAEIGGGDYVWEVGADRTPGTPVLITYLIGVPGSPALGRGSTRPDEPRCRA
jgi:hypothetical protein